MPDQADSFKVDKFSGLRNTVSPERMGPTELTRAREIDIDDAGQVHRRRGYCTIARGRFHSAHTTETGRTYVVRDGALVELLPDYSMVEVQAGIADDPLCFCEIGSTLYVASAINSFQVDTPTNRSITWGIVQEPNHRPGLMPGLRDFWYSPVVAPRDDLPPLKGKLLGAPKPCSAMAYFNGRIYMAVGNTLWATELYLYDFVDRNKGFRQYEHPITAIAAVEDGLFVGTTAALYFVTGRFGEDERRVTKLEAGIVPGSVVRVPSDLISPQNRQRLDVPNERSKAAVMMSTDGMVACSNTGQVVNLTSAQYGFPRARRAASLFRQQDGMHTVLQSLNSGGSPANETARIGDYMDATIIRSFDRTDVDAATRATFRQQAQVTRPADNLAAQVRVSLSNPVIVRDDASRKIIGGTGDRIEGLDGTGGDVGKTIVEAVDGTLLSEP